ncbi:MAG TPA: formate dehydrogenase accessory sulfurtransferase FdhD [Planctomycetota bacterium]|nr:formate dehydrogenase accessory sulfurtransferase FdhD [Planctomycetota bacterium]
MTVSDIDPAIQPVRIIRIQNCEPAAPVSDQVVTEQIVTIVVEYIENFTLLCTPVDVEALAVGFLYAEGMIDSADAIESIDAASSGSVDVHLKDPPQAVKQRNMVLSSSCGLCGTRNLKRVLYGTAPCRRTFDMTPEALFAAVGNLPSLQRVFKATGGAHAAAIFTGQGQVVAFGEDIGRHCALDKAIGKALLSGRPTSGCGVALSGRVSFEMVSKAARAGIELIAAVSAPSSLAVEAATRWNITLCGFVRRGTANIYAHPERITL